MYQSISQPGKHASDTLTCIVRSHRPKRNVQPSQSFFQMRAKKADPIVHRSISQPLNMMHSLGRSLDSNFALSPSNFFHNLQHDRRIMPAECNKRTSVHTRSHSDMMLSLCGSSLFASHVMNWFYVFAAGLQSAKVVPVPFLNYNRPAKALLTSILHHHTRRCHCFTSERR